MQSTWYLMPPLPPPSLQFSSHSSPLSLKLIMEAGENMKFVLRKFFFFWEEWVQEKGSL